MVNFRVSEDEFQKLKEGCARSGARSVSDFARSAVLAEVLPNNGVPLLELSHRWNRLEQRIETVLSSVRIVDTGLFEEDVFASQGGSNE